MTPYSRPNLSDLYTLSQSQLLENHTLHIHSNAYLYSPYMYMALLPFPPGGGGGLSLCAAFNIFLRKGILLLLNRQEIFSLCHIKM